MAKAPNQAVSAEAFGLETLVVGDLLRRHIAKGTDLGRDAQKTMKAGDLMPDARIAGQSCSIGCPD